MFYKFLLSSQGVQAQQNSSRKWRGEELNVNTYSSISFTHSLIHSPNSYECLALGSFPGVQHWNIQTGSFCFQGIVF